jgi:gamma-glutamylcyclotransferase (GGCT)/AIG2-like uncharacterized protein YtfP
VFGEIYQIQNIALFPHLDEYEGFDPTDNKNSLFVREITSATCLRDNEKIEVWIYYFNQKVDQFERILSGRFNDFKSMI